MDWEAAILARQELIEIWEDDPDVIPDEDMEVIEHVCEDRTCTDI